MNLLSVLLHLSGFLVTAESDKSLTRHAVFIILWQWLKCLPPQCITNEARKQGISSSLHMPDKVLNFVKDHFLMDSVIRSQPLLLKRNARYTQIAVHRVQTANKVYHVLFTGTGKPPSPSRIALQQYSLITFIVFHTPFQMTGDFTNPLISTTRCTS